jgi:hypothetical protein
LVFISAGRASVLRMALCFYMKGEKMIIQFPDIHAPDPETFGIAFPADVDGQRIRCVITIEALQRE